MLNYQQTRTGTPTRMAQASLSASPAAIYTATSNQRAAITDILICNTTASDLTVDLYVGSAATTSEAILYGATVSANSTLSMTGFVVMNGGDTITGTGSAVGLTATISGMEDI